MFFAVFRLNSVLLPRFMHFFPKNGVKLGEYRENWVKNSHMPGWFQNLGAVYPIGAKALLTEIGGQIGLSNVQGNEMKTQLKKAPCGALEY